MAVLSMESPLLDMDLSDQIFLLSYITGSMPENATSFPGSLNLYMLPI
ncbi:hypothetical protein Thermo_01999 [Thermoplasmatales archaeon]|nr:hypothetical protein Thermo_01999 [Thermoplasmatales archaeon]